MASIIPASKWKRVLRNTPPRINAKKINELTLHYTGASAINVTKADVPAFIKRIEANHFGRPDEDMSAIGYNFLIDEFGRIWEGRGWSYRNGANGEGNDISVSVCILVGVKDNKIGPEVINAVRDLRAQVEKRFKRPITVRGHRDHIATSCPGEAIYKMIRKGVFNAAPEVL